MSPREQPVVTSGVAPRPTGPDVPAGIEEYRVAFERMSAAMETAVLGKRHQLQLALTCLVADGHLLLEGYPGTGKTMLARALANVTTCTHARIQFTPDLLPSDVTGVTVYDQHRGTFEFHQGPVFHHLVLADEINRASPKTQSALLEVMEEGHVTVDGTTYDVPAAVHGDRHAEPGRAGRHLPAARGPARPVPDEGVARLPGRAGDRGDAVALRPPRPGPDGEPGGDRRDDHADAERGRPRARRPGPDQLRAPARGALAHPAGGRLGLSARACLAFVRSAKAWAAAGGGGTSSPRTSSVLAHPILCHRLLLTPEAQFGGVEVDDLVDRLLAAVPAPTDRA